MHRTKLKLAEAAYFLERIRAHYHDVLTYSDIQLPVPLAYYVSAYVSAARSVTWILRAEYQAVEGWEAWWRAQVPTADQAEIMSVFTEIRNRSQKAEPLRPVLHLHAGDVDEPTSEPLPLPGNYTVTLVRVSEDDSVADDPPVVVPLLRLEMNLPEMGKRDLYNACQAYLQILDDLIARCEATFGVPGTLQ